MSLLSNSLFLDSEYKADCEYKINYLNLINQEVSDDNTTTIPNTESSDIDSDDEIESKEELDIIFKSLGTKVMKSDSTKPYISDSRILYNTKKISDTHYKILLELENSPLEDKEV